jgi:hypothetical protein
MTNAKSHPAASAIVLFGLDGQGRPLAATFAADQTALALKAATSLKLQTLKIETANQTTWPSSCRSEPSSPPAAQPCPWSARRCLTSCSRCGRRAPTLHAAMRQPLLRHNHLPPPATTSSRSGHRPLGPKSMSATWCSSKTGNPKPAGTRPWSSRSLATTSSNSGSGIIPKKEPWCAAAISWRCCRQPDRQCPSAHEPPRP